MTARLVVPRVLLGAYLVVLAGIAFWPVPVDRDAHGTVAAVVRLLQRHGLPWLEYGHVESAANVALYVPLGVLGTLILRRWWLVAMIGVAVSAVVELSQGNFLPERYATAADVVANTAGTLIGALGVVAIRGLSGRGTSGDRAGSGGRRSRRRRLHRS